MGIINLGRVCPIFKGSYDDETIYVYLDVVLYNGSSYVLKVESSQGNLPTDNEYWETVAQAGTLNQQQIEEIESEVVEYVQDLGYVLDDNYVHTDNNYTTAEKNKLATAITNIKTVNNQSLVGTGNITIEGGGSSSWNDITGKPNFANVATSGSFNDLSNTPTYKTINHESILGSGNIVIQEGTTNYNNLSNKPQIGDANIQIFQGGVLKGSFNLNDREDYEGSLTINLDAGGSGSGGGITDPTETSLSGATINIPTLNYNSVYTCSDPISSLTIGAFSTSHINLETNIYFTTGDTITMSLPSSTKYAPMRPILQANTEYIMSFKHGVCVVSRIS